jgi:hypothetical protein
MESSNHETGFRDQESECVDRPRNRLKISVDEESVDHFKNVRMAAEETFVMPDPTAPVLTNDEVREAAKEQARMLNLMMRLLQEAEEKEKEKEGRRKERERELERRERQREGWEKKSLEALGNLEGKSTTTYLGQLSILNIYPRRNKKGKHSQPIPPPSCINCTISATAAVTRPGPTLNSNANSMVPAGGPKPATSLACLAADAAHRVMGAAVNASAGSQFRRYPQRTEYSRIGKYFGYILDKRY